MTTAFPAPAPRDSSAADLPAPPATAATAAEGLVRAIAAAAPAPGRKGSAAELGRRLGLSRQAIAGWAKVPDRWLDAVAAATGLSKRELRPDLFEDLSEDPGREAAE